MPHALPNVRFRGEADIMRAKTDITGTALSSPRRHVAKNIFAIADEDNAVSGRIATVPFDLGIGNWKPPSVLDVNATKWYVVAWVSDDGDILIAIHLITVRPITVCQPTAGQVRIVRLRQPIEPLAM